MVKIQNLEESFDLVTDMSENKPELPAEKSSEGSDDPREMAGGELKKTRESSQQSKSKPVEVGGRDGPDPVRYGDWEKGGRCIDF